MFSIRTYIWDIIKTFTSTSKPQSPEGRNKGKVLPWLNGLVIKLYDVCIIGKPEFSGRKSLSERSLDALIFLHYCPLSFFFIFLPWLCFKEIFSHTSVTTNYFTSYRLFWAMWSEISSQIFSGHRMKSQRGHHFMGNVGSNYLCSILGRLHKVFDRARSGREHCTRFKNFDWQI